jgi:hypothetical protein
MKLTCADQGVAQALQQQEQQQQQQQHGPATTFAQLAASLGEHGVSSSKSVQLTGAFGMYMVRRRQLAAGPLFQLQDAVLFRRQRFRAARGRRSSEDRFLDRLRKGLELDDDRQHVLAVGNGVASANFNALKNQRSTLAVGIIKVLSRLGLPMVRVPEHYTSSTCYSCESTQLEHPNTITITTSGGQQRTKALHGLLKCQNQACDHKYWQRDVLGMLNIGKQAMHWLQHGTSHPVFTREYREQQAVAAEAEAEAEAVATPV